MSVFSERAGNEARLSVIDSIPVWTVTFGMFLSEIGAYMIWGFGGVILTTGVLILAGSAATVVARRLGRN